VSGKKNAAGSNTTNRELINADRSVTSHTGNVKAGSKPDAVVQFTKIPVSVEEARLTPFEFRALCRVAYRGQCWESLPNMAKACRIQRKTLQRALKSLVKKKLISKVKNPGKTNTYALIGSTPNALGGSTPNALTHPVPQTPYEPDPSDNQINELERRLGLKTRAARSSRHAFAFQKPESVVEVFALTDQLASNDNRDLDDPDDQDFAYNIAVRFLRYNNAHKWDLNNWRAALSGFYEECRDGNGGTSDVPLDWEPTIE
jgi:hypothetical protein